MILEVTTARDIPVIRIPRRLETGNAHDAETEFLAILSGSPKKAILDFSGTEYVASAGLRVLLLFTRDLMKSGGKVVLTGVQPPVLKVFGMAGFTSIFTIRKTLDEAMQALG